MRVPRFPRAHPRRRVSLGKARDETAPGRTWTVRIDFGGSQVAPHEASRDPFSVERGEADAAGERPASLRSGRLTPVGESRRLHPGRTQSCQPERIRPGYPRATRRRDVSLGERVGARRARRSRRPLRSRLAPPARPGTSSAACGARPVHAPPHPCRAGVQTPARGRAGAMTVTPARNCPRVSRRTDSPSP